MADDARKPYAANVPGPFYVVDGCCTMCGVPQSIAPRLFGDDRVQCFVKRQPATDEELWQMLQVVRTQEFDCVRYGGDDENISNRIAEAGEADKCDAVQSRLEPVLRNVVAFSTTQAPVELLARLERSLGSLRYRFTALEVTPRGARFAVAWFEDDFHEVEVRSGGNTRWLRHTGPVALSEMIDDWLRASGCADARWYSDEELRQGNPGRERPY